MNIFSLLLYNKVKETFLKKIFILETANDMALVQWSPTFLIHSSLCSFGTFHSSPVRVCRLELTTIGTIVFTDDNNFINKCETKTVCCQIMALMFVNQKLSTQKRSTTLTKLSYKA